MSYVSLYPIFTPINYEMKDELIPIFTHLKDGISELTFASLLLHQRKYEYKICKFNDIYIITRLYEGESAFICVNDVPPKDIFIELLCKYKKCLKIYKTLFEKYEKIFIDWGLHITEDRDNFDYIYDREDLATLSGKKFHKKKNLVNAFQAQYTPLIKPLDNTTISDAQFILDIWNQKYQNEITDYEIATESLQKMNELNLFGWIIYADGEPCAWASGEYMLNESMFCIHFEKAIDSYKGVYQYVNQACAKQLDNSVLLINREQDLGNEGLRQAKLTYRPTSFTIKYIVTP
ncbi:MAG: DUF2156 domain-containing protein [Treponemataceae bacterium]